MLSGFLCGPRGQDSFLPVILRNLLAPGIDPSEMFDELDVSDLSSASEHQVLPRLDLLAARWQDSQMRLRRSSVVTPAACEETSFRPENHNWVATRYYKEKDKMFVKLRIILFVSNADSACAYHRRFCSRCYGVSLRGDPGVRLRNSHQC